MSKKWTIGVVVMGAAVLGLSTLAIQGNSVYFYTPDELVENQPHIGQTEFRVGGMVLEGSVQWDPEPLKLGFTLTDMADIKIFVTQEGQSPPDMFKEGQGVVVEGRFAPDGKSIVARNLFVKHSEEYKAPDGTQSYEGKMLMESMFKDEGAGIKP